MKDTTTTIYFWMTAFFLFFTISLMGQGWEYTYFDEPPTDDPINNFTDIRGIFHNTDGSFDFICIRNGDPFLFNINESGIITAETELLYPFPSTTIRGLNNNYTFADNFPDSTENISLASSSPQGEGLFRHILPNDPSGNEWIGTPYITNDDQFLVVGRGDISHDDSAYIQATKIDTEGNIAWKTIQTLPYIQPYFNIFNIVQRADDSYFITAAVSNYFFNEQHQSYFLHLANDGTILAEGTFELDLNIYQLLFTSSNEVLAVGLSSDENLEVYQIDFENLANPVLFYTRPSALSSIISKALIVNAANGGYAMATTINDGTSDNILLTHVDADGNELWEKTYGGLENEYITHLKALPDGGFIFTASSSYSILLKPAFIVRTDDQGNTFPSHTVGQVQYDQNQNCLIDSDEPALENWIVSVQVEDYPNTFYGSTNANGHYDIGSVDGQKTVTLHHPNDYWLVCENDITVSSPEISTIDFAVQSTEACALMNINLSTNSLRLCEEQTYTVYCSNQGTIAAEDVYVNLTLPNSLSFVDASIPFTELGNQQYTFDLGDMDFLQDTSFTFTAMVGCDIELMGQSLCVMAQIFPDTLCLPDDPNWSGASIEATAQCQDGEAILSLTNVGTATMAQLLKYTVIEDHVIMLQDVSYGPLAPGESIEVPQPANGTFYRIESEQESAHPLSNRPIAFLEGCGTNDMGETSLGFVNQYPLGDDAPFFDINCEEVVAAYDPNDKAATPAGYTDEHFLEPNTRIDYRIRFQNTGTSYANKVVIIDELDPNLNPATILKGVSSHDYDFELLADGVVRFTFNDIMLPDSTSDLAGSQGFVHFSIDQKADLPIGTLIENTAAIFFDFNPSIITNTTWHTIGRPFVSISTQEVAVPGLEVRVYPNPYLESATVELQTSSSNSIIQANRFELFDLQGRQVQSLPINGSQFTLHRNGLPAGMYFYRISANDTLIASGRVVVMQ